MTGYCGSDIEEKFLEAGDCGFGFDFGRRGDNFGDSFKDRGARGHNSVTGYCCVPVSARLKSSQYLV